MNRLRMVTVVGTALVACAFIILRQRARMIPRSVTMDTADPEAGEYLDPATMVALRQHQITLEEAQALAKDQALRGQRTGAEAYEQFLAYRKVEHQPPLSREEFASELVKWYQLFWDAHLSLGQAARKLGLNKPQLIDILDMLGWKVSNV